MKLGFKTLYVWLPLLAIPLVLLGCGDSKDKEKVYEIKGKVVAVDEANKKVTLDHEDIPGFMNAMQMPFTVEDEKLLQGIKAGDQVHGRLRVRPGGEYVLIELHKQ